MYSSTLKGFIHYEIIKEKNNTFTIALHFERGCASSNSKLVAFLKKISDDNKWEFVNKNNLMAISMKNIREIPLVAAKITELVSKTFDDVLKLVIE